MTLACINRDEIEEGALASYLSGEATKTVTEHIVRCAFCRAEVSALQRSERLMLDLFYRETCPDIDTLLAYDTGLLDNVEANRVQAHLSTCAFCAAELNELVVIPEITSTTLANKLAQMKEAGLQVITAVLQPSPAHRTLAFRGSSETREIYEAGDYQIMLVKTPPVGIENLWLVEGQIYAATKPQLEFAGILTIYQSGKQVKQIVIDLLGYLNLDKLSPGDYTLEINLQDTTIIIQNFKIP